MNKKVKLISGFASATVAVATITGVNVSAEETDTLSTNATEAAELVSSEIAKEEITEQDVNSAKQDVDQANQAVNKQQDVVNKAQTDSDAAQKDVDTAQDAVTTAQNLVNQATPAAIQSAQQDVADAKQAVDNSNQQLDQAKANQSQAQDAVTNQQNVVDGLQDTVNSAKNNVSTAQTAVDQAQAVLDGTDTDKIIKAQQQAQDTVDADTAAVDQANSNLVLAQKSDQDRLNNIASAQKGVSDAKNTLDTAQNTLNVAKKTSDTTTTALSNANTVLVSAKSKAASINTIYVSADYVDALTTWYNSKAGSDSRNQAFSKLQAMNADVRSKNTYKSNTSDKNITVTDLNNLSNDVLTDLSLFASDLINQVRTAFGTPQTVVTADSVTMSDLVTDGYISDGWSWYNVVRTGHDTNALNQASSAMASTGSIGEDLNTVNKQPSSMSMDDIKGMIYDSLLDFLFNGDEYYHAQSIAGLVDNGKTDVSYIGVDISVGSGRTSVHVNNAGTDINFNKTKFNTTPISNTYDSVAIAQALSKAQTDFDNAKKANDVAQANLNSAQLSYAQAASDYKNAQQSLSAAQAVAIQTPAAQKALVAAQNKLSADQLKLDAANQAVDNLNADVQTKTQALNNAKANLLVAQQALQDKQDQLNTAQTTLNSLKDNLKVASDTVKQAEVNVESSNSKANSAEVDLQTLLNAPTVLAEAQSKLSVAEATLNSALTRLKLETEKLNDLVSAKTDADNHYARVLTAYRNYLDAKHQKDIQDQKKAIEDSGKFAIPQYDTNGQLIGYVAQDVVTEPVDSGVANISYKTRISGTVDTSSLKKQQLPSTGEGNNSSLLNLAGVMGLLGLSVAGRRRKRKA